MPPGTWYWIILIGANTPVFILMGWPIFGSWSEFGAALASTRSRRSRRDVTDLLLDDEVFRPDVEPGGTESWRQAKLVFFVAACGAVVALEHSLIRVWFP